MQGYLIVALMFLFVTVGAEQHVPSVQTVSVMPVFSDNDSLENEYDPSLHAEPILDVQQPYAEDEAPVSLDDPSNVDYSAEYDPETGLVTLYRKIGDIKIKLPYTMTLEEYNNSEMRKSMQQYLESKNMDAEDGKTGQFRVNSEAFESVFGSNAININAKGTVELTLGVTHTFIDNPTLTEESRKTTTFDFEQKIQVSIDGSIGEKLKLDINYNTEATFDFDNQVELSYEGDEDDIIKNIEVGDVSLTLPGTLITGSESLFGVKTDMQFGKLSISTVLAQQQGETSVVTIEGGDENSDYEISADEYDENRNFFLSLFFRDQYNDALENSPMINSAYSITTIEVWVTNTTSDFDDSRNIVAFTDLAENSENISNSEWTGTSGIYPSNSANDLYEQMTTTYSGIRDISDVSTVLSNFSTTSDYEKIENARLLDDSEYTLNSELGYIMLNNALDNDEILAVAYEYTYGGTTYKVGELTSAGYDAPNTLVTKLIKGTSLTPSQPTWDLMMKNVYSIGAYDVSSDDFSMQVTYLYDSTATYISYFPEGETSDDGGVKGELFISLLGLDNVNSDDEYTPDGVFDFVDGYTILASKGRIIFPVVEPFGEDLASQLPTEALKEEYAFYDLYTTTQTKAESNEKNKFQLEGTYSAESGTEISLNAYNISEGSVTATAGGTTLTENVDYSINYTAGTIQILNTALLESGTAIEVSLESQSLYNMQTKTFLGAHFDYQFTDNFNVGATIMHLSEQPLTTKVAYGNEPISNTVWGLNTSYYTESNWLTSAIDKLPFLETKAPSSISFEGEFAQLIPGEPSSINDESYIDDFESTETAIDLTTWSSWQLASTPQGQTDLCPYGSYSDDLRYGYNRAKLAWYVIDPLFTNNGSLTPSYIENDPDAQSNHYVREVYETELFPLTESEYGESTLLSMLNLAYYPSERGPYNFDTDLTSEGLLNSPETRWGGMMRSISTTNFESTNINYVEFWIMDPFIYDEGTHEGGDFYIDLGSISEDILKDTEKFFEQGLPGPDETFDGDTTVWGYIPDSQSLVDAFSNDTDTRLMQDVGLDGVSSDDEVSFCDSYLSAIKSIVSADAYDEIEDDPAGDDFHYFRGTDYDEDEVTILDRYKKYNNPEANSTPTDASSESYSTAATTSPDMEDINSDNTLSETESYFQYHISLRPEDMVVGENCISDMVTREVTLENGNTEYVNWYQFQVPIASPEDTIGDIEDTESIRFMRMFFHGFSDSIILRFASLDLVRSDWTAYEDELTSEDDDVVYNTDTEIEVSAVSIEENGDSEPVNYVLPPGVDREVDATSLIESDEQSLTLTVTDLGSGDSKAAYKSVDMDWRQYTRLKMYVHAEEVTGSSLEDGEMHLFIRMGSDYQSNYYEYDVPLDVTPASSSYSNSSTADRYAVWPEDNTINLLFELLLEAKLHRNDLISEGSLSLTDVYECADEDNPYNTIRIKGSPNLAEVQTLMIGVRNATISDKSVEVWVNELRLSGFNDQGGWAARAQMDVKLADLGSLSVSGNMSTVGYGAIGESVTERNMDDFSQYNVTTNLELGKLLGPKSRLSIPFYFSLSEELSTPEYYPLDPDIKLDLVLDNTEDKQTRDSIRNISQDYTKEKSFSFSNVRIQPKEEGKTKFYSPSNISATYSYNETYSRDVETEYTIDKNYKGVLSYDFENKPKAIEPFKNIKSKSLAFIRDFNFYLAPTKIGYEWEVTRGYSEEQLRNLSDPGYDLDVSVDKDFYWNRYFNLSYNLTKALKMTFKSTTNASIDEPDGVVNKDLYADEYDLWKDSVMKNILNFGRITDYEHSLSVSYTLPINKFPLLDWTSASVSYAGTYTWDEGTVTTSDYDWGHTIYNTGNWQGNSQLNFSTLYNKSKYLKELNKVSSSGNKNKPETVRFTQQNLSMKQGEVFKVNHKLGTTDVTIRVFNESGRPVRGRQTVIDANTLTFVPEVDVASARVIVSGKKINQPQLFDEVKEFSARLLTSVKNVSVAYSKSGGTTLPGYLPDATFLGSESLGSSNMAPGLPFILGWQDRDFGYEAVDNGWITTDTTLSSAYIMTNTEYWTLQSSLEPISGLKINLTGTHKKSNNLSEYYLYDTNGFDGVYNTTESGSFSMSFNTIGTAFKGIEKTGSYQSDVYDQFLNNRQVIARRLGEQRAGMSYPTTGSYADADDDYSVLAGLVYDADGSDSTITVSSGTDGYSLTSQDVMIPAFLAAYSGTKASNIFLDAMPSLASITPNWSITYSGLSKVKWLQKYFSAIDLSHSYSSVYSVSSYETNSDWEESSEGVCFVRDASGNFVSQYDISSVSISEQFSPLIKVSLTLKNSLTTQFQIKKGRSLSLSLTNNKLTESYSNAWVIGLGYTFDQMDLIIGTKSNAKKLPSDLDLSFDLSVSDTYTIIRSIEEESNELSAGQKTVSLEMTADYALNSKLNIELFYDRNVSSPYISTSYPVKTNSFGITFQFSLSQ
jgi:cell surface protein SprA